MWKLYNIGMKQSKIIDTTETYHEAGVAPLNNGCHWGQASRRVSMQARSWYLDRWSCLKAAGRGTSIEQSLVGWQNTSEPRGPDGLRVSVGDALIPCTEVFSLFRGKSSSKVFPRKDADIRFKSMKPLQPMIQLNTTHDNTKTNKDQTLERYKGAQEQQQSPKCKDS